MGHEAGVDVIPLLGITSYGGQCSDSFQRQYKEKLYSSSSRNLEPCSKSTVLSLQGLQF